MEWVPTLDPVSRDSPFSCRCSCQNYALREQTDGVVAYSSACHFQRAEGGRFSISRPDGDTILTSIMDLLVSIVSTDNAEVHGLTTTGINSRWGVAVRSQLDFACWTGPDFEICTN